MKKDTDNSEVKEAGNVSLEELFSKIELFYASNWHSLNDGMQWIGMDKLLHFFLWI